MKGLGFNSAKDSAVDIGCQLDRVENQLVHKRLGISVGKFLD